MASQEIVGCGGYVLHINTNPISGLIWLLETYATDLGHSSIEIKFMVCHINLPAKDNRLRRG